MKLTVGEAKATVLDKLEQFLSRHSASEDLGLRLDGEQLAAGVRFVRIVREGSYDVVVGNPPYQGLGKTSFSGYVAKHYPRGKADLYAAFLERGLELTREGGLSALLTMRGWMFLGQFKELRQNVLARFDLRSIGDFDRGAFDEVPNEVLAVAAPVLRKSPYAGLISVAAQPTPLDDSGTRLAMVDEARLPAAHCPCRQAASTFRGNFVGLGQHAARALRASPRGRGRPAFRTTLRLARGFWPATRFPHPARLAGIALPRNLPGLRGERVSGKLPPG